MSISMALTRGLLRFTPTATATAQSTRAKAERGLQPAEIPASLRRIAHVQQREIAGCTVYDLTPKRGAGGAPALRGGTWPFGVVISEVRGSPFTRITWLPGSSQPRL